MKKMRKLVSLLLGLCLLLGACAVAEEPAAPAPIPELNATDVLATVGDTNVTWADVEPVYNSLVTQYGNYYDLTVVDNVNLFRAVALENKITETVMAQKAVELGLTLTQEEIDQNIAQADANWNAAVEGYIANKQSETAAEGAEGQAAPELTDEEKAALKAEAEQYLNDAGWTLESLREEYQRYAELGKVEDMMVQDAVVTDEEVEAEYQRLVAADKELYENEIVAYAEYNRYVEEMAMYAAMYGTQSDMEHAWYKPDGFRAVKHILLPVDEALMTTYTDLQARFEEQQNAAEEAQAEQPAEGEEAAEAEPTAEPQEPVTEQQISEAKAAIFASLADKIDEINQKIADGADFDELIAAYGLNADGTPSDPGMVNEPYKTVGYEVCSASYEYVPEFVEAAMSIDKVGEVSAPYLSNFGVHIVKYIGDVPGGPVPMTDAERQAKYQGMLQTKQSELYAATMETWIAEANVAYTGVTPSMTDLEAAQAQADAEEMEASDAVTEEEAAEMVDETAEE